MPTQETFFTQQAGSRKVEVIKTYDESFAREAFGEMNDEALRHLWNALRPEDLYEADELPKLGDPDGQAEDFLWDELCDQAYEDRRAWPNRRSFFVVLESDGNRTMNHYVSPDWPSAESYSKNLIEGSRE